MDLELEHKLPSGAKLKIQIAPFADAKNLYQAILREAYGVQFSMKAEMTSLLKDLFCVGFASQHIEACLWECFKRCTIDGLKIDKDTFEPVDRRDDYMKVCIEVAKANILPFVKSLYAEYQAIMPMIEKNPE